MISKSVKTRNLKSSSKNSKAALQSSFCFSDKTSMGRTHQTPTQSNIAYSSLAVVRQPSEQVPKKRTMLPVAGQLPRLRSSNGGRPNSRGSKSIAIMPAAILERSTSRDSRLGQPSRNSGAKSHQRSDVNLRGTRNSLMGSR